MDEQLNCSICLDTCTDPKLLQCFHTYCTKCLIPLVRGRQGQLILTCPACRKVTPIPPNGVRGLQSAFQINDFIGIRDDPKKVKDLIPSQEPGVEGDATSQTPSKRPPITALSMLVKKLNSTVKPATSSSVINVLLEVASTLVMTMDHLMRHLISTRERSRHHWSQWRSNSRLSTQH